MVTNSSHRKIFYFLDQKNAKWKRTIKTLKLLSARFMEICATKQIYLRSILIGWQHKKRERLLQFVSSAWLLFSETFFEESMLLAHNANSFRHVRKKNPGLLLNLTWVTAGNNCTKQTLSLWASRPPHYFNLLCSNFKQVWNPSNLFFPIS